MPIIEGYDELETGGFTHWKTGTYPVTITGAVLADGERKDGSPWYAIDITVERADGATRNERLFYPGTTAEWQAMRDVQRKVLKSNLEAIGINMAELESDTARAALIGKPVNVEVKVNGEYTNYYFRTADQGTAGLPEPTQVFGGTPVVTTTVEAIVV